MPELSILISCLAGGIGKVSGICDFKYPDTEYILIHQMPGEKEDAYAEIQQKLREKGIQLRMYDESGLSKSRNHALDNAEGKYMLLCDEDVHLLPETKTIVVQEGNAHPDADILVFRIRDAKGVPYKNYPAREKILEGNALASVSSVEMVIRRNWWLKHRVYFDERFGLGAEFPGGEEFIFLRDAVHKGAKVIFIPKDIVIHPQESSGKTFSPDMLRAKGAMMRKVYGNKAWIVSLVFGIKKFPLYKNEFGLIAALRYLTEGSEKFREDA